MSALNVNTSLQEIRAGMVRRIYAHHHNLPVAGLAS